MENSKLFSEQKMLRPRNGLSVLILNTLAIFVFTGLFVFSIVRAGSVSRLGFSPILYVVLAVLSAVIAVLICPILYAGLKILRPNEALVLTLFGQYYGTLEGPGFFFVNPFVSAVNPTKPSALSIQAAAQAGQQGMPQAIPAAAAGTRTDKSAATDTASGKAVSLKVMALDNNKQKVNDKLGNPIEIGVVVIWRVVNAAKAVFNVDNYMNFLSIQADSALRNIVRMYPYDIWDDGVEEADERSIRGSSLEVAQKLKEELQSKVEDAGLEIMEARITHLAYAPEIAAAMLQRQQASAIIDARKLIVEGAVSMVEMALQKLNDNQIVDLDDERKAAMVSNLLVILCGNKEAQPIVNSGSIY